MSQSIVPIHYVNAFNSNVFLLSQQMESRLMPFARVEKQNAEMEFYDYYDKASEPVERTNKYADLQAGETNRGRRMASIVDYDKTEWISHVDKLRMIHDPQHPITQSFSAAFGRKIDRILIEGLLGTAYEGKQGQTAVALPNTQKVVAFDGTTTTGVGLNVKTLRAVKKKFHQNEAVKDGEEILMVVTAEEIDSMLGQVEVTSADYNSIKALVNGAVDTFMGFRFIRTELVPRPAATVTYTVTNGVYGTGAGTVTAARGRRCIAFTKGAVLLAQAEAMTTIISRLDTKGDVIQIFSKMTIGSTRLEDVKVVEVVTSEA